jgi:peptide-methionine (S)-S-oxide reductase
MRPIRDSTGLPDAADALLGRPIPVRVSERHAVPDAALQGRWPDGTQLAVLGLGCFWGAERLFWPLPGVISTSVGVRGWPYAKPDVQGGLLG